MTEAIRGPVSENDLVNRARGEMFVGRREELAQLASTGAEVAGSGRGRLVVIAGDAGVGKSGLVREFCGRVSGDGWTVAAGGCVDVTAQLAAELPHQGGLAHPGVAGDHHQLPAA